MGGSPCPVEVMKQVIDRMNCNEMTVRPKYFIFSVIVALVASFFKKIVLSSSKIAVLDFLNLTKYLVLLGFKTFYISLHSDSNL